MTSPLPNPPGVPPVPRTTFPAAAAPITVVDPLCGHLPGECWGNSVECAYWRGVATGEYPPPEAYFAVGTTVALPPYLAGLKPLTDPALRGAA